MRRGTWDDWSEHQGAAVRATGEPWLIALGRAGYAAKGGIYVLIGALAVQVALGHGGATTDQQGALAHIAQAPFGRFLLITLAVGLVGYSLWRFLQAAFDTEHKGGSAKGIVARLVYAGIGAFHWSMPGSAHSTWAWPPGH